MLTNYVTNVTKNYLKALSYKITSFIRTREVNTLNCINFRTDYYSGKDTEVNAYIIVVTIKPSLLF